MTIAARSPPPPLDMHQLEAALKKVDDSRRVKTPTGLSSKTSSATNGILQHKLTKLSSHDVSTTSPPLSPDAAHKLNLSPDMTSSSKKLRPQRSPSPPLLAVRQKHSPTSPREHIVISLPVNHKERAEYLLKEYDYRMKMHIAYQAASFELQNVIGSKKDLKTLVFKQKKFEQEWPSTRSKAEISSYGEYISITTVDDPREEGMEELIKESQELIKLLQQSISSKQ